MRIMRHLLEFILQLKLLVVEVCAAVVFIALVLAFTIHELRLIIH